MGIEAKGAVYAIMETQHVSERFTKREFVLELHDNPKYPQLVLFQVTGDRVSQLDDIVIGEEVRVEFSLRGREWRSRTGEIKYFNSLDVWRIESVDRNKRSGSSSSSGSQRQTSLPPPEDDIPF